MWRILSRLYLGRKEDSEARAALRDHGISNIVNCAAELPCLFRPEIDYLELGLKDPDDCLESLLPEALSFINQARTNGAVLVHCTGAVSRSPALVLAYLCHTGLSLDDAARRLGQIIQTRPNSIFLRQIATHFDLHLTAHELTLLTARLGRVES